MRVIYHSDADGCCAAACVKFYLKPKIDNIIYYPMDYNKPFPFDMSELEEDEAVWILDFSFDPSVMDELLCSTKNVVFIDHHKTAIEKYKDYDKHIEGLRVDGISGCELTYLYITSLKGFEFNEKTLTFNDTLMYDIPQFIRLIGDRDVWRFYFKDASKFFHLGLHTYDISPESKIWEELVNDTNKVMELVEAGVTAGRFRDQLGKAFQNQVGFETEFEGFNAYAMNMAPMGSEYFTDLLEKYDFVMPFAWTGEKWKVSMYSGKNGIDVSKIAKKYGGGGHISAAGYYVSQLPFNKKVKED